MRRTHNCFDWLQRHEGQVPTGVVAPDGVEETWFQVWYECEACGAVLSEEDVETYWEERENEPMERFYIERDLERDRLYDPPPKPLPAPITDADVPF